MAAVLTLWQAPSQQAPSDLTRKAMPRRTFSTPAPAGPGRSGGRVTSVDEVIHLFRMGPDHRYDIGILAGLDHFDTALDVLPLQGDLVGIGEDVAEGRVPQADGPPFLEAPGHLADVEPERFDQLRPIGGRRRPDTAGDLLDDAA